MSHELDAIRLELDRDTRRTYRLVLESDGDLAGVPVLLALTLDGVRPPEVPQDWHSVNLAPVEGAAGAFFADFTLGPDGDLKVNPEPDCYPAHGGLWWRVEFGANREVVRAASVILT